MPASYTQANDCPSNDRSTGRRQRNRHLPKNYKKIGVGTLKKSYFMQIQFSKRLSIIWI